DHAEYVDSIDSPVDWADDYGQRFWGWLKPPQTGDYTFWVAGDDLQEFWLSSDASPINISLICQVTGWTNARDFDGTTGSPGALQKSSPISLTAGQKYYFLVLGKEDGNGDSTSAAWQGPGIETREIIMSEHVDLFGLMPLQAFRPSPADGTVDTLHEITLSWNAGEQAEQHEVYLGTDANAVATADTASPLFQGRQTDITFDTGELEWGATYYWRVDEVGANETWKGTVWSFATANYLLVDDMESYTDEDGHCIYQSWGDGYSNLLSGSTVGYLNPPFAEQTIVHGGKQSMPFDYDNTDSPYYSEAEMTFPSVQNWTIGEVDAVTMFVRGYPAFGEVAVTETAGKMNVTGSGADIWGNSDEFTYVYKTLTGDGTLVARVVSIGAGTNTWAKGGVMIRDSLNGGSTHAMTVLTANSDGAAGNGACFQYRAETDGASTTADSASVIAPPYWVKIERIGDNLTGYISVNGTSWNPLGYVMTVMTSPVYVGLCVTSHQAGENRTYEFDNIVTTGGVSGVWQGVVINSPMHNSVQPLYVTITDSTGKKATVANATAVNATAWTEVKFPLTDFGGVSLAKVEKLIIGVGDPANPAADGTGRIFIDDIRITRP
ncbi:MAG: PA14 domain-containing protein, partial [Phycisphaerales bacterium]